MNGSKDDIARRAARLLAETPNLAVKDAISRAIEQLGLPRDAAVPSVGLVRRHAEGLAQSRLGEQGYAGRQYQWFVAIIDVIRQLEHDFPAAKVALVGRACTGHFDADPHVHLRFIGEAASALIADALVRAGLPDPAIKSFHSRVGVLDQIHTALPFAPLTLTRCPPRQMAHPELDLQSGKPVPQRSLVQLEEMLAAGG